MWTNKIKQINWKPFLQFSAVLVVGFFIGFFTQSTLTANRLRNYRWNDYEQRFWTEALNKVNATDAQKEKILPIVKKYGDKGHQIMRNSMAQMEPLWNEMYNNIKPLLNKEQWAMFQTLRDERMKKLKDRSRGHRDEERPGPLPNGDGAKRGLRPDSLKLK